MVYNKLPALRETWGAIYDMIQNLFELYVSHHTDVMKKKHNLNPFRNDLQKRTGKHRLLLHHHWMKASHTIYFMKSGKLPGVMNIWSKVATLVCHNVMVTMDIRDAYIPNGDLSLVYVEEITKLKRSMHENVGGSPETALYGRF